MSSLRRFVRTRTTTVVEVFDVLCIGKNDVEKFYFGKAKLEVGDPEDTRNKDCVVLISYAESGHSQVVEIEQEEEDYGEA